MKWNSHDRQRATQSNKNESYTPFGGKEIIHIPVRARIKLGFLLMIGVEIANIHVDTKNSGIGVALAWVEAMRKLPGMDKVWRKVDFAFGDSDQWICRECGCTDDDCSQCIEATGYPCRWLEPDLCSRCKDEMAAAIAFAAEVHETQVPGWEAAR